MIPFEVIGMYMFPVVYNNIRNIYEKVSRVFFRLGFQILG